MKIYEKRPLGLLLTRWLASWEVYLILAVSLFLRLYRIDTTEFDGDQADIFAMAHNAVSHAHLVATGNIASIKILNPPAIIYALMLPAAFSRNPLWGAVLIALQGTAAVLLTYVLTRRYYGRFAGTLAALFYGIASAPIFYSRFLWNQNMLLLCVPLFICLLFRGVVARQAHWLFPAVVLLGLLLQFHASSVLLAIPLACAFVLAPRRTWHWYELVLSAIGILCLYFPYIIWLYQSNFHDIATLLNTSKGNSVVDAQALLFYLRFLGPLLDPMLNELSLLFLCWRAFLWVSPLMAMLVCGGALLALWQVLGLQRRILKPYAVLPRCGCILCWWRRVRASPERCGYWLLLAWQIGPLLYLTRHDIVLHLHYFILFAPGQFMLAGIFLAACWGWIQSSERFIRKRLLARLIFQAVLSLLIAAQGLASLGYVWDAVHGRFDDLSWAGQYYNDLSSLQTALKTADQIAVQRHLHHLYINADLATVGALDYLAGGLKTATTVIHTDCLLVPAPTYGDAVLLTAPRSQVSSLAVNVAHAHLIRSSPHPGGPPFHIYVLHPWMPAGPTHASSLQSNNFLHQLHFLSAQALTLSDHPLLVMDWGLLRSAPSAYKTNYTYTFMSENSDSYRGQTRTACTFNAMRAGDQVLVPLARPSQTGLRMHVSFFTTWPETISYSLLGASPLYFDTFHTSTTPVQCLRTSKGTAYLDVAVPKR